MSAAPKFTPGPWCAWQADPRGSRFSVTGPTAAWAMVARGAIEEFQPGAHCQEVIAGAEKQTVAMVFGENEQRAEHSAHLIAAAPLMYAYIKGWADAGYAEAADVIAKAEGKQ